MSASGASIRTELGIHPAAHLVIETLAPALGMQGRELPACTVRACAGEIAVEWMDFASAGVFAVLAEAMLVSGGGECRREMPTLGRVPFCALAPTAAASTPRAPPARSDDDAGASGITVTSGA